MFQQPHQGDWEHNEFDPRERRSCRGEEIRRITLRQMEAILDWTLSPGEIWGIGRGLEDCIVSRIWTTSRLTAGRIVKSSISSGSKIQRSSGSLTPERATYSYLCSQNFVRQPNKVQWASFLGICAQFLRRFAAKVVGVLWTSSHWGLLHGSCRQCHAFTVLELKITVRFLVCIARQHRSFMNPDRVPIFLSKMNGSPPKYVYCLEASQVSQSSWWHRFAELQTIRGNWIMVWRVRRKQIRCRMTEPPGFSNRQFISTIELDTFHSGSRVIDQKYLFWYKIISDNDRLIELELMNDCISRNPMLNETNHCQNAYRVLLCPKM
jgi:hypothetical protein